jgi:amino acid transporter
MSEHVILPPALKRRLGLPLLVLYGVGITIGARIYVLIGAVAALAGRYAAWSFILAAAGMAFTVGSYSELAARFPVSAGEAAYVRQAFGSKSLSRPDCRRSSLRWLPPPPSLSEPRAIFPR